MNTDLRLDERALDRRGLTTAAEVASRAFFDDPFFEYLAPKATLRERGLTIFFRTYMAHLGQGGRVVTVRDGSDTMIGVAAWLPTDRYPQSIGTQLAQVPGTFRALYRRPRSLQDGNRYLARMAKVHPKEPHWYLLVLVAEPARQRGGVGTLLLQHGLAHVDAEGVGSYLETQKFDNIAYYRRFGYELRDTLTPVTDGPPIYTMWREPR